MGDELAPGAVVDGFLVEERIHAGGMATLYRVSARDATFPLVMKVPRVGHGEPVSSVISWETECTVLAHLRGRHVPRFVAAGDPARHAHLVMERIEGRPLVEWTGRGPLPPAEVARLGAAVATALQELHLQDAVHLDVKPSNVILRPDGTAVLVDFGVARHAHFPDLLAEEYRRPIGSAPYMAPEQLLGDRSDPRSDLFALGAVLYELATGRLPFGAPTSPGGLRTRLYRDPVPPRAIEPGVPEWLQEIVLRAVDPDARERHATAAQLAFDLSHPEDVAITERGRRLRRAGVATVVRRWVRAAGQEPSEGQRPRSQLARAPIVLVAVATLRPDEARFETLREAVRRVLASGGDVRVACVSVVPPTPALGGDSEEETATRKRIKHLVLLRHFAEPLRLGPARVSMHVVESGDPVGALLEYARVNHVDHIVIGAPPAGVPAVSRGATVAMRVADAAPCTVTLARPAGG
jgi:eukaryotic-like serine/threonine-protein kinase